MKRLLITIAASLLLFADCAAVSSAADLERRFSMAISGGASKGAYEAGLNWGLLKMMQEVSMIDQGMIGEARHMEAASFAGASAGGINTLLSGLTWCSLPESEGGVVNRIDQNIFRDVWLIPDVNRLLPPTADSPFYSDTDALLSRHDLMAASGKLRERWNQPGFRPGCHIPLGVTVTRVVPEEFTIGNIEVKNQRLFIPFVVHTLDDGTLGFYFDPAEFPTLPDPAMILMPRNRDAPPHSIDDQLIEDAVVTSSAYPGAFGRTRLQYCRLSSFADNGQETNGNQNQQKTNGELVCPDGYELSEAEFADGGLFDNLPLGLARQLAEQHIKADENILPVTYVYLDPNRLRYKIPPPLDTRACASDNPPEACRTMEFSFFTEHELLLGALGTARKYELYRELTSEYWTLSLTEMSYEMADQLEAADNGLRCVKDIPMFSTDLSCAEAIRRAGSLLDLAYTRSVMSLAPPYSAKKLRKAGIADDCEYAEKEPRLATPATCRLDIAQFRRELAKILLKIANRSELFSEDFKNRIEEARLSIHNDRVLRVTDRGAPITGTLLSDFGAFLDLKFREYDYYVGVYDAVITASHTLCGLRFSDQLQYGDFVMCQNTLAAKLYRAIDIESDPRGDYVFARLARWEFGERNMLRFAYEPLPEEDHDMRIIFDGLIEVLEAGEKSDTAKQGLFFTENTFFLHLKNEGFEPTATVDGSTSLLAEIIANPANWPFELTRRATTRFVYLEQQAERIYAEREPDPALRENSHTTIMGAAAFGLQSVTYTYPDFTFAPSTAPENWIWRNIIPYEIAIDLNDSDLVFTWQPTWALTRKDLLNVRASIGLAGGVVESTDGTFSRKDYFALGLGYSRRTESKTLSSWGITPTWYYRWDAPPIGDRDTIGGHVHVSFFEDRLRLGLGMRDVENASETWFFTVGIADIPGWTYWLTR
ncbi:MAG: patatin-like phospholipase family protein [Thiotrichales bacterium]|nr:MAG: patatin-like phospholipase family protein [Thiotrichales bacterium]